MSNEMNANYADLSVAELRQELVRLRENLCDLEEIHAFTFGKTTVHIGADQAQAMQEEYEEECGQYNAQIAKLESILKAKEG